MSPLWLPRLRAALRLLLLQAGWNFERMQNLGWAFCMEPAVKALYPDPQRRSEALRRHMEFFNTHPYMAGYVLGAAIKAEEEASMSPDPAGAGARVSTLKMALAGPFAAVGDSFYWATLRPATALLAVTWLWLAPRPWDLWAPLAMLVAYNAPCLWLRMASVQQGWRLGSGPWVALHVARLGLPAVAEGVRLASLAAVAGLVGGMAHLSHPATHVAVPFYDNFIFLGAGLLMLLLLRLRMSAVAVWGLSLVGALLFAFALP